MARIRSLKPEFWEDETVASLSRDARLLFIATLNMADDEGLLRWTPEFIKANAFMYDDDLTAADVAVLMKELTEAQLILAYRAGRPQRQLGWVINFRRHQNINRPQSSKLPPPSIQSSEVIAAYKRRDGFRCHICGVTVSDDPNEQRLWASLDHVSPRSQGGSDQPTNIRLAHVTCNKARQDAPVGERLSQHAPTHSVNRSLNDSVAEQGAGSREQGTGNREIVPRADTRGSRLPDEWVPDQSLVDWQRQQGIPDDFARRELPRFRDYWAGTAGAKGRKADWPATWRNWLRRAWDENPPPGNPNGKATTKAQGWLDLGRKLSEGRTA